MQTNYEHNPEAIKDVEAQQQPQAQVIQPVVPAPTAQTTTLTKQVQVTKIARFVDWGTIMLLVAMFSVVVMIVSAQLCSALPNTCNQTRAYQVAVGVIGGVFGLIFGLLHHAGLFTNEIALEAVSALMFLWWLAGVIVLTFFGDFQSTVTANGYFGSWGAFLCSTLALVSVSPRFGRTVDNAFASVRSPLLFLAAASGIVMGAAIGPCSPQAVCYRYNAFAVALGVISLVISLVLLFASPWLGRITIRNIGIFLCLWWVIGTGVVTFGDPFIAASNGYFASYAAIIASVALLQTCSEEIHA